VAATERFEAKAISKPTPVPPLRCIVTGATQRGKP